MFRFCYNLRNGVIDVIALCDKICKPLILSIVIHRGSYLNAHVLLNLLIELGKVTKCEGCRAIYRFLRNEFDKFNTTTARMLDSIHHITLR